MNTDTNPSILLRTSISLVLLSSFLLSNEASQLREVDLNEKNLLTLFEKENAKTKAVQKKKEAEKEVAAPKAETNQSA